ncbi:MAG TPA: transporter substrate-binding domain-containing protein [Dongiaceae bacterium]|jgi:polar amino acid transport system substrate-binding protein|nr:transporter substrate-binding domain-containing protein [Dongiaceae bacterium]
MKKTILGSIVAGAVMALATFSAHAEDTIKFGVAAEPYPPFTSPDASGKWVGWEVDLMDAVCAEMKAKCEIVPVAWDGIIQALQAKKFDVIWSSMSITDERKKQIDFTDKYYQTPAVLIGPKSDSTKIGIIDNPTAAGRKIIDPASVKGKIIGAQIQTIHANYVKTYLTDSELKLYDTQDNCNADLVAGRIDYAIADSIALDAFIKSDQGKDMEVKATVPNDPIFGDGVGGGLRKDDTALREKLNAAIAAVRKSGKYDEISKKYFNFDIYGS